MFPHLENLPSSRFRFPAVGARGFSLIELLLILAILGIVASIAMPAFSSWRERTAVNNAAHNLIGHLKKARIMVLAESREVDLSFATSAPYGYTYDVGEDDESVALSRFSPRLTLAADWASLTFSSNGTVNATGSITIASPGGASKTIEINGIGRAYLQ